MQGIDPKTFEYALRKIDNGFVFESIAQEFLSYILGYSFTAAGEIRDRGIDGLEHTFHRDKFERNIYQASIDKSPESKIKDTVIKLIDNKIPFDQLTYVTNQKFPNQDQIIDNLFDKYHKPLRIYDVTWFSLRVNKSTATVNLYHRFVAEYLHEFAKPGKSFEIADLVGDPRLFVFLRQQWEEHRKDLALDEILADTLILYCLEETDPDQGIVRTTEEIKESIPQLIHFDPKQLYPTIEKRLTILSQKPRRIKYHGELGGYCLPYETRLEIQERNLKDVVIYEDFITSANKNLQVHLKNQHIRVKDCTSLITNSINRLYYQQGLEFSNFVLQGESQDAIEKNISEIISEVVEESSVIPKNRRKVKTALLLSIRDIVYRGDTAQKEFLSRLSSSYMMLFLLQCDPKITTYFRALSSQLEVYVCTSIIIPALSEYHLELANRRHWNLLKGAHAAGVTLVVNENIIREIVAHFKSIKHTYNTFFRNSEDIYLDELQMLYIDEILIRAYFYAKMAGKVRNFDSFLDNFVNPDLSGAEEALIIWLKEEFGIVYRHSSALGLQIDSTEEKKLLKKLIPLKNHQVATARSDVHVILTIYALREQRNELDNFGILGYKTWWLSKDTTTYRVVNKLFKHKYRVSCYMRPDFLYNYIALAPSKEDVETAYRDLFPSLIGANISFHLPPELVEFIHKEISAHKQKSPARIKAILRELGEKLKYDPSYQTRTFVEHYLDEKLKEIEDSPNKT